MDTQILDILFYETLKILLILTVTLHMFKYLLFCWGKLINQRKSGWLIVHYDTQNAFSPYTNLNVIQEVFG